MRSAVLQRLYDERQQLVDTIENVLGQVEGRDLTDAELAVLGRTKERIAELELQIKPLEDYEAVRDAHRETRVETAPNGPRQLPERVPAEPRRMDGGDRGQLYPTAGSFVVDYLRAMGILERGRPDSDAMARVQQARAVANQTTGDTPGLLPTPIVGQVVNIIDASRPFITSIGGTKALAGIPGTTFSRPTIAQHVVVGEQTAEKTELPSQKMSIAQIPFAKKTYGGTVDISRQDIDWTQPAAWDILVKDLADVYSRQTEQAIARDFAAKATGTPVDMGTAGTAPGLSDWTTALYTAAMRSYNAGMRMPDRIWCSLDVWASLGSMVDAQRVVLPPDMTNSITDAAIDSWDIGSSGLASFRGDVLGLPRIVCPQMTDGTCIVGPSTLFEAYEEVIGLLSVIEPSILGVEVAYGGYVAWGHLEPGAFVPLSILGTLPTTAPTNAPKSTSTSAKSS
jgi:HK97 family phage major capsid protein